MHHNKSIHVHFELIAVLGDQPEQRGLNKLMLENSKFGARYSYAADVESITKFLSLYQHYLKCARKEPGFLSKKDTCINCVQWNFSGNDNLLKYDPPKHYPDEMLPPDKK